jgi:hypothetical protein
LLRRSCEKEWNNLKDCFTINMDKEELNFKIVKSEMVMLNRRKNIDITECYRVI